jgi:hypothetical protein
VVDLLREAAANARAAPVLSLLLVFTMLGIGVLVGTVSIGRADRALDRADQLAASGRFVDRVSPQAVDGGLPASYCDSLGALDGVVAAGGFRVVGPTELVAGDSTVQAVTPGLVRLVAPTTRLYAGFAYAGALVAERNGLRDGAWTTVALTHRTVPVGVLPRGPRTDAVDDSLLLVTAPVGTVDQCWVELRQAARGSVEQAIPGLAPDGVKVLVNPLRDGQVERPESALRAVPGDPLAFVGGIAAGLALLMSWYARRQEWTLYRVFGLRPARLLVLLALEWVLLAGLPLLAGAAWAVVAHHDAHRRALMVGWANTAVVLLLALPVIGIWSAVVARCRPSEVLKGA